MRQCYERWSELTSIELRQLNFLLSFSLVLSLERAVLCILSVEGSGSDCIPDNLNNRSSVSSSPVLSFEVCLLPPRCVFSSKSSAPSVPLCRRAYFVLQPQRSSKDSVCNGSAGGTVQRHPAGCNLSFYLKTAC